MFGGIAVQISEVNFARANKVANAGIDARTRAGANATTIAGAIAGANAAANKVNTMDLNEELQLVEDAKTDSASFAKLYDYYFPKVFAYVMAKVGDRNDAEDLVSETFMKVLEHLPRYENRGLPFGAWVFTIARNNINNFYGKSSRSKHSELKEGRFIVDEEKQKSPRRKAEEEELATKVKEILKDLPERELNVIQLKFFSQLSNREIMHVTGLSESNVAVILFRTLKKIKPDLKYFA